MCLTPGEIFPMYRGQAETKYQFCVSEVSCVMCTEFMSCLSSGVSLSNNTSKFTTVRMRVLLSAA